MAETAILSRLPEATGGVRPQSPREQDPRSRREAPVQAPPIPLPMESERENLINLIISHTTIVIKAGTGTGKSTLGPLICLEGLKKANPGGEVRMIVAEPRQMLAEGISKHVAKTNRVPLGGDLIGYYHGDSSQYSPATQIVYTVNGSLRKRIEEDKSLATYDAVFLDEIHLRDTDQEAILIGLKEVQKERAKRHLKPLKIIIASASADAKYGNYYGNAAMIEIEGQKPKYQVEKHFATKTVDRENIPLEMARKAAQLIKDPKHKGDVLGFLPGRKEIQIAQDEFNRIMQAEGLAEKYKSASLTGGGGAENKALQARLADDNPTRDPIAAFATDVAETGATFARLTKVIDSGLLRENVFNKVTGLASLQTRNHAFSHFLQRLGRLGRTGEGEFHALYPEADLLDESKHPKDATPAILKEDLAPFVLSLKNMGIIDVHGIDYLDHPGQAALDKAVDTLDLLGALKPDGTLTEEGKEMAELPFDPHFARMLVEAKKRGCVEAVGTLIGFLNSGRTVFTSTRQEHFREKYQKYIIGGSDYRTLLNVWNAYIRNPREMLEEGFSPAVLRDAAAVRKDIVDDPSFKGMTLAPEEKPFDTANEAAMLEVEKCMIAGFMDRVIVKDGAKYKLANESKRNIELDEKSAVTSNADMLIAGEIITNAKGTFARLNESITNQQIKAEVEKYIEEIQRREAERASRLKQQKEEKVADNPKLTGEQTIVGQQELAQEQKRTEVVQQRHEEENKTLIQHIKDFFKGIGERIRRLFRRK